MSESNEHYVCSGLLDEADIALVNYDFRKANYFHRKFWLAYGKALRVGWRNVNNKDVGI